MSEIYLVVAYNWESEDKYAAYRDKNEAIEKAAALNAARYLNVYWTYEELDLYE